MIERAQLTAHLQREAASVHGFPTAAAMAALSRADFSFYSPVSTSTHYMLKKMAIHQQRSEGK